jgi:hypothetical protein
VSRRIREKFAQHVPIHNLYGGKNSPKMSATSVIFKKIPKRTNRQMGENSPNLVTLLPVIVIGFCTFRLLRISRTGFVGSYLGCWLVPWLLVRTLVAGSYLGCWLVPWLLVGTLVVGNYLGCRLVPFSLYGFSR